jgi:hypothetical protein
VSVRLSRDGDATDILWHTGRGLLIHVLERMVRESGNVFDASKTLFLDRRFELAVRHTGS